MKIFIFISFIFLANFSNAGTEYSCTLNDLTKYPDPKDKTQLSIFASEFKTEAILKTRYGVNLFTCSKYSLDTYECYGFAPIPGETPSQLNILQGGMKAGTIVVHTKLNLFFVQKWRDSNYASSNFEERRFSIDSYSIKNCD